MFDLVIRNGTVIDGTRAPAYSADVCIKGDRIVKIAQHAKESAKAELDARGKSVAPGFLDIHCHSDLAPLAPFQPESMPYQGVTFELCGNCGESLLPSTAQNRQSITEYFVSTIQYPTKGIEVTVNTMDEYAAHVQKHRETINYGMLIGHGILRGCIMGFDNRSPTAREMSKMEQRLDQELSMGAFGMSLGLVYPPSAFAEAEEIEALARVVRAHNGVLTVHMRNEGPRVFEAVDEMLGIAERSGVRLQISHLKIMTKSLWGQSKRLLKKIDAARERGVEVNCDQYPFSASSTSLTVLVPKWAHSGGISAMHERLKKPEDRLKREIAAELESRGGPERVLIVTTHGYKPQWQGKTLAALSKEFGEGPVDTALRVLVECRCSVNCIYFSQDEEDMLRILSRPDISVGSDGYNLSYDRSITTDIPHPRSICTFPRALELLRDKKLLPPEDAVYKMTGLPAQILGLTDRGILAEGKIADITIFDASAVGQVGDYKDPFQRPRGIETVIVSGQVVMADGKLTGRRPGTVLRHKNP